MHPLIERYLEQVKVQLKRLSAEQRSDEVRELRSHLQTLVEEGKERGLSENKAVQAALAQFGPANKVGRDLNSAVLHSAASSLPKAFSVMTFLMMGQAALILLSYLFWMVTGGWEFMVPVTGGMGALWLIGQSCFYCAISLALALSLRQLRPWAFWLTLIFLSHKSFTMGVSVWKLIFAVSHLLNVSFFSYGFVVLQSSIFFLTTLFCLSTLVLNRQTYLRLAGDRWRT